MNTLLGGLLWIGLAWVVLRVALDRVSWPMPLGWSGRGALVGVAIGAAKSVEAELAGVVPSGYAALAWPAVVGGLAPLALVWMARSAPYVRDAWDGARAGVGVGVGIAVGRSVAVALSVAPPSAADTVTFGAACVGASMALGTAVGHAHALWVGHAGLRPFDREAIALGGAAMAGLLWFAERAPLPAGAVCAGLALAGLAWAWSRRWHAPTDATHARRCLRCGTFSIARGRSCPQCGASDENFEFVCSSCWRRVDLTWSHCSACGASVTRSAGLHDIAVLNAPRDEAALLGTLSSVEEPPATPSSGPTAFAATLSSGESAALRAEPAGEAERTAPAEGTD